MKNDRAKQVVGFRSKRSASGIRRRQRKVLQAFRTLIVLEVGAGNRLIGAQSASFARCMATSAHCRRVLLRYVNHRAVRGTGLPFNIVGLLSSDLDENPANDLRLDILNSDVPRGSVHVIISVGPRGYGFANTTASQALLSAVSRILCGGGEFLVFGSFMNPWFNLHRGSLYGRAVLGEIARNVGLRLTNYLLPIGRHKVAAVVRNLMRSEMQHRMNGQVLRPPSHLHRFVKLSK